MYLMRLGEEPVNWHDVISGHCPDERRDDIVTWRCAQHSCILQEIGSLLCLTGPACTRLQRIVASVILLGCKPLLTFLCAGTAMSFMPLVVGGNGSSVLASTTILWQMDYCLGIWPDIGMLKAKV